MNLTDLLRLPRTGHIGVYITDGFLAAVQVKGRTKGKKLSVVGWSMRPLPSEAVKEGQVVDQNVLAKQLEQLFQQPNYGVFKGKEVVLTMPEHQSYHHVFSQSGPVAGTSLYSIAYKNTMPHVPYGSDEVYWDWQVIKRNEKAVHFYSVAVPRDVLTPFRTALTKVGYSTTAVETEILSSTRFFFGRHRFDEGMILVQVGHDEICVSTVDEMGVHQSSIIPDEGMQVWALQLAKELNVKESDALKMLLSNGLQLKKGNAASKTVATFLLERTKLIAAEAEEHRQFFLQRAHEKSKSINDILVIGGGGLLPGLGLYLSKTLKLQLLEPKPALTYSPAWEQRRLYVLHQACGAALLGLEREQAGKNSINVIKAQAVAH